MIQITWIERTFWRIDLVVQVIGASMMTKARGLATRPFTRTWDESHLPDDTRLWAALQNVSGGTWGGCVYDVDKIIERLGEV
jgi:hypothetical protein